GLDARHAAPGRGEAAIARLLERPGAGRVVRGDVVDAIRDDLFPETAARPVADRWSALQHRTQPGHVAGAEREVVRAGLGADVDAVASRAPHRRQAVGAGHVDDVHARSGLARGAREPLDGDDLRLHRAGCEPAVRVAAAAGRTLGEREG